jgi:lipoprotein signal peptidase
MLFQVYQLFFLITELLLIRSVIDSLFFTTCSEYQPLIISLHFSPPWDQDQLTSRHILLSQIVLNYNNGVAFSLKHQKTLIDFLIS